MFESWSGRQAYGVHFEHRARLGPNDRGGYRDSGNLVAERINTKE